MTRLRIRSNKIKCKKCGDIVESKDGWNFKKCNCGAVAVDGGHDYLRRVGDEDDYIELSDYKEIEPYEDTERVEKAIKLIKSLIANGGWMQGSLIDGTKKKKIDKNGIEALKMILVELGEEDE